jgi:ferrous iron transport protein B
MSCGARLAIYAVFVSAFFRQWEASIIFALYLIGIAAAIFTGWLLRKTLLQGSVSPLVMELPPYHMPQLTVVMRHTWRRLWRFISRAGRVIIPVCIVLGLLSSINFHGQWLHTTSSEHSLLAMIGRWLTPVLAPMGVHADNWPATVGLLTGVLAKEVVIGTLDTLYGQMGHTMGVLHTVTTQFDLWGSLTQAVASIHENFIHLIQGWQNPLVAIAPLQSVSQPVYDKMGQLFDGRIGIFAYLLFVLLYFPCISTTAVIVRELNWQWANLSMLWSTGIAYAVAVIFYQLATLPRHWASSLIIISLISACFALVLYSINLFANQEKWTNLQTTNSPVGG